MNGYRLLADAVLVLHAAFILWAMFGGLAGLSWRFAPWLHLPALAWGAWIISTGGICPLTPWEVHLRQSAGQAGYEGSFIEHYLLNTIYPPGLTRGVQVLLALVLVAGNAAVYAAWWRRRRRASVR